MGGKYREQISLEPGPKWVEGFCISDFVYQTIFHIVGAACLKDSLHHFVNAITCGVSMYQKIEVFLLFGGFFKNCSSFNVVKAFNYSTCYFYIDLTGS